MPNYRVMSVHKYTSSNFYPWHHIRVDDKFTIQINQPTWCNSFTSLLLDVYVWLNMSRAGPLACWH